MKIDHCRVYEEDTARAYADYAIVLADGYQALRDACQKAWYNYQVSTGQIETPSDPKAKGKDNDREKRGPVNASGGQHADNPIRDGGQVAYRNPHGNQDGRPVRN